VTGTHKVGNGDRVGIFEPGTSNVEDDTLNLRWWFIKRLPPTHVHPPLTFPHFEECFGYQTFFIDLRHMTGISQSRYWRLNPQKVNSEFPALGPTQPPMQ